MSKAKKPLRYNSRELQEIRQTRIRIIVGVVVSIAVLGCAYGLSTLGPRGYAEPSQKEFKANEPEIVRLREEILATKKTLMDKDKVNPLDKADIETLDATVVKQRELIAKTREYASIADTSTLEQLLTLHDKYSGEPLWVQSNEVESQAMRAMEAGQNETAVQELRKALELQKTINTEHTRSPRKDPSRQARLQALLSECLAKPVYEQSVAYETKAKQSIEAGDVPTAMASFREAIALQQVLLQEHRNTRYAEVTRMKRLESELATAQAQVSAIRLDKLLLDADATEKAGDYATSGRILEEAIILQRKIQQTYPTSKYAQSQLLDTLEVRRQTVMSRDLVQTIQSKSLELDNALKERKGVQARLLIEELNGHLYALQKSFKKAAWNNEALQLKLRFLDAVKSRISEVQDEVWDNILGLPGQPDRHLALTEVPQGLYQKLLGQNPSKNSGTDKPVDSVTWAEANEFCLRLSWLIGYPVELPTEADYRTAVGPEGSINPEEQAWHSQNANGEVQPVRTRKASITGYYDLLGNVSEWMQDTVAESADQAQVFGGSIRDNEMRLRSIFIEQRPKMERQRLRGFRFVVVRVDKKS
ncbi:MAG: SUMF1/EgtB/PvdO family nonheme iron enzyme [Verrucomicrobiota bacterium]|nr:SUMF1/EgtB/PvdO family nonheme iron enzyme [Verrucomicrobiota bacterium]